MFEPAWRRRALASIHEPFDLVVLGAGITGAGVFLDAAQRGLRVVLVERGDVGCGTSSRSSKLIHGGLRYLKQMQFRITRLACRERDRLLSLSPHLVRPVPFVYPAYTGASTPGWQVDLGLWMYDRLTSRPERHSELEPEELAEIAPDLDVEGLDRALLYGDALTDDARLTLAVVATGCAYGGVVLTRAEAVDRLEDPGGRIRGVEVRDLESGRTVPIEGTVIVNATGHWVDRVRGLFGCEGRRVRPSRGVHLVFGPERLDLRTAVTIPSPDDGRPVFVIPHPEGFLLGTTDLYHDGSLDDPRPSSAEVGYLLRTMKRGFPGAGIGPEDVKGAWAGLRPILDTEAETPSEASREEAIWEERGLLSVAGGKLTTYRVTAEEVVDRALKSLAPERVRRAAPCRTGGTPLVGLAPCDLSTQLAESSRVAPDVAAGLARRLGSLAWTALHLARGRRELGPLLDGTDLSVAEIRTHLRYGAVVRLEDLLLRRVRLGMWDPPAATLVAEQLRPIFAQELGWRGPRWERELELFDRALDAWRPVAPS